MTLLTRRNLLRLATPAAVPALGLLSGCGTPLPLGSSPPPTADAAALDWLQRSARFHGAQAFAALSDVNVAYDGRWSPFIDRIQPEVVDKPYRQRSEERLLLAHNVLAQAHVGPAGRKQVWRRRAAHGADADDRGDVGVWYSLTADTRPAVAEAAALVADCYRFFLLGPLWLDSLHNRAPLAVQLGSTQRLNGRACQWVLAWLRPGLGLSAADRVALAIDRDDFSTRRLRFTLEGAAGTRGAVAEVDWLRLHSAHGVQWPSLFHERVVHPLPDFAAHDWALTGLDVNRGYGPDAVAGPVFSGKAAAAARPLQPHGQT